MSKEKATLTEAKVDKTKLDESTIICGIIMPISEIDGCNEAHWSDVMEIIVETIHNIGFEANLVSNSEEIGVIQKRIIQNLYENPIVVCDVSGRNPNVMFELGIRLAFDKPTVIIKDDKTSFSFDTSPIEHLTYPRDLRYNTMIEFKGKLCEKIKNTYEKSMSDPSYSTFLKHFGEFKVAKINHKEVTGQEFIIDELKSIKSYLLENINTKYNTNENLLFKSNKPTYPTLILCLRKVNMEYVDKIEDELLRTEGVKSIIVSKVSEKHFHLKLRLLSTQYLNTVEKKALDLSAPLGRTMFDDERILDAHYS